MRIGDVSRALDIPASTIRYYERAGLLKPAIKVAGKRVFDKPAMLALRFIKLAKAAGFTINEMKSLLENYDQNCNQNGDQSGNQNCGRNGNQSSDQSSIWRPLAEAKRESVREQLRDLQRMDVILGKLIDCECATLSECVELGCAAGD